jgi:glucose/arabinose dehydrogenase
MLCRDSSSIWLVAACVAGAIGHATIQPAMAQSPPLTGSAAFGDWHADKPGTTRLIGPEDLQKPGATPSVASGPHVVARPPSAVPQVPDGFKIALFAEGLSGPREMRVAPNGDIFVAETGPGRIRVLRAANGEAKPTANEVYASGLNGPFGIAFYPAGNDPKWVYVANNDSVVRFPYHAGDLKASAKPETVVAEGMDKAPEGWIENHPLGESWGGETDRADVLAFDPEGKRLGVFATGIRNCVGLATHPVTGDLYCSTNERDGLGDNLVPDYVTRVREGAFYGWPWFYLGANEDPRHPGQRADLKDKITLPDVLLQAHSASLGLTFYNGSQFPSEYSGDGFAAEHGSWNRSKRTGYKVIRIRLKDGIPTGEYQDFVTGFVIDDSNVWGRPVGVAVAHDGALLVSEDGNGTIWRITH